MSPRRDYRYRPLWLVLGWIGVAGVLVMSLMPLEVDLSEGRDKISHFLAYGSLMFWFGLLFTRGRAQSAMALALGCMGVGVEFLQGLTGYRSLEAADMAANVIGVAMGWAVVQTPLRRLLHWVEARMV